MRGGRGDPARLSYKYYRDSALSTVSSDPGKTQGDSLMVQTFHTRSHCSDRYSARGLLGKLSYCKTF